MTCSDCLYPIYLYNENLWWFLTLFTVPYVMHYSQILLIHSCDQRKARQVNAPYSRVHTDLEKSLNLTLWLGKSLNLILALKNGKSQKSHGKSVKVIKNVNIWWIYIFDCTKLYKFLSKFLVWNPQISFLQLHACSDRRSLQAWSCENEVWGFQISEPLKKKSVEKSLRSH